MPKRKVLAKKAHCLPEVWAYLNDMDMPGGDWEWTTFDLEGNTEDRKKLWHDYREEILPKWIQDKPGTRPSLFWEFDVPMQPKKNNGWYYDGTLPVPRKRIKGVVSGGINPIIHFYKGIPAYEPFDQDVYFESEASYLTRHGLLLPGEADRLKAADFKPQAALEIIMEKERCRCY